MIKIALDSYTRSLYHKICDNSTTDLDNLYCSIHCESKQIKAKMIRPEAMDSLTVNPMPQTPAAATLRAVRFGPGKVWGIIVLKRG